MLIGSVNFNSKKQTLNISYDMAIGGLPGVFYTSAESFAELPPFSRSFIYTGRIILLIDAFTSDTAETYARMIKSIPGVVVVGSPTAGSCGYTIYAPLLNNLFNTTFTYLPIHGSAASDSEGRIKGVQPDIEVCPTLESITDNRDIVLERAVELAK